MINFFLSIFALAMTASPALAQSKKTLTVEQVQQEVRHIEAVRYVSYFFGDTPHAFVRNSEKGFTVSKHCGENLEGAKCLAAVKLKQVNMNALTSADLEGGKNPGSVLCRKSLKAKVLFGKDLDGNVSSFCAFEDGTMLSSDTLVYWGKLNAATSKN